jgi:hypothetical protein
MPSIGPSASGVFAADNPSKKGANCS